MKMVPITFRQDYSNDDGNCRSGFTPFTEGNKYIYKRYIIAYPFYWDGGSAVEFSIYQTSSTQFLTTEEISFTIKEEKLSSDIYYDSVNAKESQLIDNLASNDLRGYTADRTASSLFFSLFLYSESMKLYLPEVVKYYSDLADKHCWKKSCGIANKSK